MTAAGYSLLFMLVCSLSVGGELAYATTPKMRSLGKIDQKLVPRIYSGNEQFKYDVSWTGGIKIGEIYLAVNASKKCEDCFEIDAILTTNNGLVHRLYPVKDRHVTTVRGPERLPYFCEIWQKQGRSYTAHKIVQYDQEKFMVTKQKDGDPMRIYELKGKVHNEFSSFLSSRLMDIGVGKSFIVPTFGDDKRNNVVVETLAEEPLNETLFGEIQTLKVSPVLTFSGLYDKRGDTVIWYTDDECRVPVRIQSKILIGSLTAKLAEYRNPHCRRYHGKKLVRTKSRIDQKVNDKNEIK